MPYEQNSIGMVLEVERFLHGRNRNVGPMTGASVTPIMPAVWPFSEPQEPVTVYERVRPPRHTTCQVWLGGFTWFVRELDRAEGDLWRNEPSFYGWAA